MIYEIIVLRIEGEMAATSFRSNSSCLKSVKYNEKKSQMTITFNSGHKYRYENVSPDLWRGFLIAESHGKFFHAVFRGQPNNFPFTRLT